MTKDATQEFLTSLPEIRPDEQFWFSCHPSVPCFNACCSDLTMPLTPYDVLRLCRGLSMGSEEFIEEFAFVGYYEDTGFPLLHLRMENTPDKRCPFVTEKGCGVYADRSSACRTYPLGRATRPAVEGEGLVEQYFLVREEHCEGFAENTARTIASWLQDQEIAVYNRMNDRYMRLISGFKSRSNGAILSNKHATMALLCLYQQDRFMDFIQSMRIFSHIGFIGEHVGKDREQLIRVIMENPEKRLCFAYDWMELVLFGATPNLRSEMRS